MSLGLRLVLIACKIVATVSRILGFGTGFTWPGEIAIRLKSRILADLTICGKTIILVSGTNGKTTTVKMIETVLKRSGMKIRRNPSGANLDNGVVSGFIDDCSWSGDLKSDIFIFEVDEAAISKIALSLNPRVIVLLNLFRDQLDRFGEVDTIADHWLHSLQKLDARTHVLLNGDDPQLVFIGSHLTCRVTYFGLDDPSLFLPKMQHATDSIYCPKCGARLTFGGIYFSHLGKWACGRCGLTHPELFVTASDYNSPLEGVYNKYNALAAAAVARFLGLLPGEIQKGLSSFTPAFGRLEELSIHGKNVKILLSKNPTGFNESLRTALSTGARHLLLVLNDRIPDGRDVSWIWDVDFEKLADEKTDNNHESTLRLHSGQVRIFVSGDRCYDLALRLKYAGLEASRLEVHENLRDSIVNALSSVTEPEILWILPTYSAMLEVRSILTGKKIS